MCGDRSSRHAEETDICRDQASSTDSEAWSLDLGRQAGALHDGTSM